MNVINTDLIMIMPVISLAALIRINNKVFSREIKYFFLAICTNILLLILEMISIENNFPNSFASTINIIVNTLGFILAPVCMYFILCMMLAKDNQYKYRKLLFIPIIINTILAVFNLGYGLIFSISSTNEYKRGILFLIPLIISLIYVVLSISIDLCKKRNCLKIDFVSSAVVYVAALIALFIQLIFPEVLLIWASVSVCMFIYYINMLTISQRHDNLTKLYNRNMYDQVLIKSNNKNCLTIIAVDVNNFKKVNDTLGHLAGDRLLSQAAISMEKAFKQYGHVYRVGGDEFYILCSNIELHNIKNTFELIENDLEDIKRMVNTSKLLSYGYVEYAPEKYDDIFAAVDAADQHMYKYKAMYKPEEM